MGALAITGSCSWRSAGTAVLFCVAVWHPCRRPRYRLPASWPQCARRVRPFLGLTARSGRCHLLETEYKSERDFNLDSRPPSGSSERQESVWPLLQMPLLPLQVILSHCSQPSALKVQGRELAFFFFFLVLLAVYSLSQASSFFALFILETGSCFCPGYPGPRSSWFMLPIVAGMTGVCTTPSFFPSKQDLMDLPLPRLA
jgi:hypothetical protein